MIRASDINALKIYFGQPYQITEKITIYQPSIRDIMEYGENEFFSMLYIFIGNTTMRRLELWENGMDWNKICDYELFCSFVRMFPVEKTAILFKDVDFTKFDMYQLPPKEQEQAEQLDENGQPKKLNSTEKRKKRFKQFEDNYTFYNEEQDIQINAQTYHKIAAVLRQTVHIYPKSEYTVGKTSKQIIIDEQRAKLERAIAQNKDKPVSTLLPLISACVNHPGFKYKTTELKDIKINEFMDSVKRLQVYEATHALLGGMYSGFCDTSKIPKDNFDFMRSIKDSN